MKRFLLIILVVGSLFSMTSCSTGNKDVIDEASYRDEYVLRLSEDPKELAEFLDARGELHKFVDVKNHDYPEAFKNAVAIFPDDEEIHDKALARAKEIFAETHIDCNWEAVRELDNPTPIQPRATNAETGEPISDEPGEFWLPPEDLLTEEDKEFRSQVIEAAGLDEDSPDFEEQLIKLYAATDSLEYPNYKTYKLFIDRLKYINK